MYKNILVPLDGSELSESILTHVTSIALGCESPEVILFRTREPLDEDLKRTLSPDLAGKLEEVNKEEIETYLEDIAQNLDKQGVKSRVVIGSGKAADEILDYATKHVVDLIMMSTHGRGGLSRWAFGSVADKVVRNAHVPVFIKPPSGSR
jgi:nucleotide-binding universal stress UspA family protein